MRLLFCTAGRARAWLQHEGSRRPGVSRYPRIGDYYSHDLAQLVDTMLRYEVNLRPTAGELLKNKYVVHHLECLRQSKQRLLEGLATMLSEKPGPASPSTLADMRDSFPF